MHPLRHRRAIRRLQQRRGEVGVVLFVCRGNICRSPYAEAAFRRSLAHRAVAHIQVSSAGFIGPGRAAPATAVEVAARRGVDLSEHRSQLIDVGRARAADLIVVMDPRQKRQVVKSIGQANGRILVLPDLLPRFDLARAIPDPVDQPPEAFDRVYAQIDRCLEVLGSALS